MRILAGIICLYIILHGLGGCVANNFLIGAWYDRRDHKMAARFSAYADFDRHQRRWIKNVATAYHDWHRKTQLPLYSLLLTTIKDDISSENVLKKTQVKNWMQRIDDLVAIAIACHPLNQSADFLASLTDEQVTQVENTIWRETEDAMGPDPTRRFNNIVKWSKRIGVQFDHEQRSIIQDALSEETSLAEKKRNLLRDWKEEFLHILGNREAIDFKPVMQNHIGSFWKLSERSNVDEVQFNRALWIDAIHEILMLQPLSEREKLAAWLEDMAAIMKSLSFKEIDNQEEVIMGWTEECRTSIDPQQ